MNDYRIFVGAFPTGELAERIQAIRLRYDSKTAHITAPHVTLAGTYWRSGPPTPKNEASTIARLRELESVLQPFDLVLGGIQSFLPQTPVIYLQVERTAELLATRQALVATLGPDKHQRFTPHLTLTQRLSLPETQTLLDQLQHSEWHTGRWSVRIEQVWLMQRGSADPAWRAIQSIRLGSK